MGYAMVELWPTRQGKRPEAAVRGLGRKGGQKRGEQGTRLPGSSGPRLGVVGCFGYSLLYLAHL